VQLALRLLLALLLLALRQPWLAALPTATTPPVVPCCVLQPALLGPRIGHTLGDHVLRARIRVRRTAWAWPCHVNATATATATATAATNTTTFATLVIHNTLAIIRAMHQGDEVTWRHLTNGVAPEVVLATQG